MNDNKLVSEDAIRTANLFCNAAIEARVIGLNLPAMSITGSGPMESWQLCSICLSASVEFNGRGASSFDLP